MNKLITKLKEIKEQYALNEENFNLEFPATDMIDFPTTNLDNFSKHIYLKDNAHKILNNDKDLKFHYWLIQKWGGISSFKENERNNLKISKFKQELEKKRMSKDIFGTISSLSKISSFLKPEYYSIYDSRVIYSLNWLLMKYTSSKELFPQPSGRNKEIVKYDLNTINNLLNKDDFSRKVMDYKYAYFKYCDFINEVSLLVFGKNSKPYQLEMLLFIIAPEYIVKDIKNSVKIHI